MHQTARRSLVDLHKVLMVRLLLPVHRNSMGVLCPADLLNSVVMPQAVHQHSAVKLPLVAVKLLLVAVHQLLVVLKSNLRADTTNSSKPDMINHKLAMINKRMSRTHMVKNKLLMDNNKSKKLSTTRMDTNQTNVVPGFSTQIRPLGMRYVSKCL